MDPKAQLEALVAESQRAVGALLDRAQRDLEIEIRRLQDSTPGSFTVDRYHAAMERVRTIVQSAEDALAAWDGAQGGRGVLVDFGRRALALGLEHAGTAPGSAPALAPVLLERLELSVRNFGYGGVSAVQRVLADVHLVGCLSRQDGDSAAQAAGFDASRGAQAAALVRTELAYIYATAAATTATAAA